MICPSGVVGTTAITGFREDTDGAWIAELACGHSQHMRHAPPWQTRSWVTSAAGRAEKIGASIDCPLCQMPSLPAGAHVYKCTDTFSETTVPASLLNDHRTKSGTWAKIVVESGQLEYRLDSPRCSFVLTSDSPGFVPPTVPHQVKPLGPVAFHIEFFRL